MLLSHRESLLQAAHSRLKPPCSSVVATKCRSRLHAVPIPEIASIATSVESIVNSIASHAPAPLQPAVQVIGGDIASVAALAPTIPGLARLTVRESTSE